MTTITIDRALLEQALDELLPISHNSTDDPRGQADKAISLIRAELAKPVETSHTAMQLAAMVLSDCGISTNHTSLHERVAARITRHEDELIDSLKKLANPPSPAWHDAPEVAALKAERDAQLAIYDKAIDNLQSQVDELVAALKGVIRVADRKTDEFDAARAAIAKAESGAA